MASIGPFVGFYLVFVAMMVGSFINLAADRLPRGESVIRPRSHCRACGRQLNAIDLLPIAGFLLRGGRCASCRVSIGVASPVVEAVSGASMVIALLALGTWPGAAVGFGLVALWGLCVTVLAVRRGRVAGELRA